MNSFLKRNLPKGSRTSVLEALDKDYNFVALKGKSYNLFHALDDRKFAEAVKKIEDEESQDARIEVDFDTGSLGFLYESQSSAGQQEMIAESISGLITALLMGILFIFLILAAQFESFMDPFAILFSLPFAIIGALLGLFLSHSNLSMMAFIGIIMLMGLVTKNAILLIDFTKQSRAMGAERSEAILQAGFTRLRPIIMTTLAMIFGMLPTALSSGAGVESRAPMAYTIIGGLITSTFLTLVVVPAVYTLLDDLKGMLKKNKSSVAVQKSL